MAFVGALSAGRLVRGGAARQCWVRRAFCPALLPSTASNALRGRQEGCRRAAHMSASSELLVAAEKEPDINVVSPALDQYDADLLVIGLAEAKDAAAESAAPLELPQALRALDERLGGSVSELIAENKFKGKANSSALARFIGGGNGGGLRSVALFGLGKHDERAKAEVLRRLGAFAVTNAKNAAGAAKVGVYIADLDDTQAQHVADGAILGGYKDRRFKKPTADDGQDTPSAPTLELLSAAGGDGEALRGGVSHARGVGGGVLLAKQLVDAPANYVTPQTLADAARGIAEEYGLSCEVLDRARCEELGMGSYLAVARASSKEPQFIHLTYTPPSAGGGGGDAAAGAKTTKKVVIIGKGLTFDSGGYNLKAGAGSMIELMKLDMGGSAATFGAAKALGELRPRNVEVHFIVAACENMISGDGMRPGDIITASNGTTIEVLNTDAEGRLTLADALVFAEKLGDVDYIVDLATLTGAMIVSLGNEVAGMWSTSDELAERLLRSSAAAGEKMWRMPLVEEYAEMIKGKISDLKNIGGGRAAGSITAALFLREFVKATPWAHIDIAGTAYTEKAGGATGYGVRTLVELVRGIDDGAA